MDFRQSLDNFLSMSPAKLAFFLALFLIGGVFGFFFFAGYKSAPRTFGFPFAMNSAQCVALPVIGPCLEFAYSLDWPGIALDAAVWYLVACALVFAYGRMVKR